MKPEIQDISIVLVGDFNPKIFHPAWFSSVGLVQFGDISDAKIDLISSDVSVFTLDWLKIMVTQQSFTAVTTLEPFARPLRDLVIGTFQILHHTPITKIGINRNLHFKMRSEEEWHRVGHTLAPKDIWNGLIEKPGMISLTIEGNAQTREGFKGVLRIRVEPSLRCHPGVFFNFNDHYELESQEIGCEKIIALLENSWESSFNKSMDITTELLRKLL